MFPDVPPQGLSSLVESRRRSTRILQHAWRDDVVSIEQIDFRRDVTEAIQSEADVRISLEHEASKWTELNRLRRNVYIKLHEFLSSFERTSSTFSAKLKEIQEQKKRIQIDDAVKLFVDSGACPVRHIGEVSATLERALRLLAWRGGFFLETECPQKRTRSNYQIRHRVAWDVNGPPSECLKKHLDLLTIIEGLSRDVSVAVADAILTGAHVGKRGREEGEDEDEVCAICLDAFSEEGEAVTRLGCGHRFHAKCLKQQLSHAFVNSEALRCGLCRQCISFSSPCPSS